MTITIDVAYVFETEAANQGLTLIAGTDIDDVCYGAVNTSQATLVQWLQKHSVVYNFQMVDRIDEDGLPIIQLRRRAVDADLVIDLEISASDCIQRDPSTPAIIYTRADPHLFPREVQIQYIDFERQFGSGVQTARHPAARRQRGVMTIPIDFVLAGEQARLLAFDTLYRMWSRQLQLSFEYPDPTIEPGDVINVIDDGTLAAHVVIVESAAIDPKSGSTQIESTALLTSRGYTFDPLVAEP